MIKVPVLIKVFHKLKQKNLNYRDDLVWYADSVNYPYNADILASFTDGKSIQLSKLVSLMITYSDNHASPWCQKLAGGGIDINAWLSDNGFKYTRVSSRTPGRKKYWEKYRWGQTTPKEMAIFLELIRSGNCVSLAASEEMYRILTNIYWYGEALSGDYVLCIITNNQEDTTWDYDKEGFVLIRDISRIVWSYLEPEYQWQPAEGLERYH